MRLKRGFDGLSCVVMVIRRAVIRGVTMQKDEFGVIRPRQRYRISQSFVRIRREISRAKDTFDFHKLRQGSTALPPTVLCATIVPERKCEFSMNLERQLRIIA